MSSIDDFSDQLMSLMASLGQCSVVRVDRALKTGTFEHILTGQQLSVSDVLANLAAPRTVRADGQVYSSKSFSQLITTEPAEYILTGAPGEGKTSFLNMLAAEAWPTVVFVRLEGDYPDEGRLEQFAADVAQLREQPQFAANHVCLTYDRATDTLPRTAPDMALSIIATSHGRTPPPKGAVTCLLDPPNAAAADQLDRILKEAVSRLQKSHGPQWIRGHCPNILNFLKLTTVRRLSILGNGGPNGNRTLLVGLLEATYGPHYRQRLEDEYETLAADERRIYATICLFSCCDDPLTSSKLRELLPPSIRDVPASGRPWVRDDMDHYHARHSVIAALVLEHAARTDSGLLEDVFSAIVRQVHVRAAFWPNENIVRPLSHCANWHSNWDLVNPGAVGEIRGCVRAAVTSEKQLARAIITRGPTDYYGILAWHYLLIQLTSKHPDHCGNDALFDAQARLIQHLKSTNPQRPVLDKLDWMTDKRIMAREWEKFDFPRRWQLWQRWCRYHEAGHVAFLAFSKDLLFVASEIAPDLLAASAPLEDVEKLLVTSTVALAELSFGPRDDVRAGRAYYTKLADTLQSGLSKEDAYFVFVRAYQTMCDCESLNVRVFEKLADCALACDDPAEATAVLLKGVEAIPAWGAGYLRLARTASPAISKSVIESAPLNELTPRSAAFITAAKLVVEEDDDLRTSIASQLRAQWSAFDPTDYPLIADLQVS